MSYELKVGIRYLFSRKGDFLISMITAISVIGVAVGVTALLVVLSVVTGFEKEFRDKILGNHSHLLVFESGRRRMQGYAKLLKPIGDVPGVKAVSPYAYEEVLLRGKSGRTTGVVLYGIEPDGIGKVTSLGEDMLVGEPAALRTSDDIPGIIVGAEIANHSLFLLPGDSVDVVAPQGELSPFGMGPKIRRFRVVGIFKSGLYEYDSRTAYVDLKQAQRFFALGDSVSGLQVSLHNPNDAFEIADNAKSKLGSQYVVRTWMEINRDLFSAFKLEKTVFFIVMTMIILVAAFNIIGTLVVVVTEKNREIAILKAIGARRRSISRIFMVTGLTIGTVGTCIGLALAYLLIVLLRDYIQFPLNSNVYQLDKVPATLNPLDFAVVALAAITISFLSTLYPSLKASRLQPSEGLRYE